MLINNKALPTQSISVLLFICLFMPSAAFALKPRLPSPPGASIQTVSGDMTANGMPVSVRKFESDDTIEKIIGFYKKKWARGKDDMPGYRQVYAPPWFVITRLDGNHLLAVQIQAVGSDKSWGYLSISDVSKHGNKATTSNFPAMSGSGVLSETSSTDPGKKAKTLSLVNKFSVDGNVTFYRDHYLERGWTTAMDHEIKGSHALTFSNKGKQVRIVIQPSSFGSTIVANVVETTR